MNVRLNSMIGVPRWLTPVVLTVTRPTFGRDFDGRVSRTSLLEYTVSPSNNGLGSRTSSHPRFATAFCVRSVTDCPRTIASVQQEFTRRFLHCVYLTFTPPT